MRLNIKIGLLLCGLAIELFGVIFNLFSVIGLGMVLLGAIGLFGLLHIASRLGTRFNPIEFYAYSCLAQYFIGSGLTLINNQGRFGELNGSGAGEPLFLLIASIYVVLFCAVSFIVGTLQKASWHSLLSSADAEKGREGFVFFLGVIVIFQLYYIASGTRSWGYNIEGESNQLPVFESIVGSLAAPIAGTCGWLLGSRKLTLNRFSTVFLLGLVAVIGVELVWALPGGRRDFTFQLCSVGAGWLSGRKKEISAAALVGLIMSLVPFISIGGVIFFGMRKAVWADTSLVSKSGVDIALLLKSSIEAIRYEQSGFYDDLTDNVSERGFIIGYLASLAKQALDHDLLWGRELVSQIVFGVPSALMEKAKLLSDLGATEYMVPRAFGLIEEDTAKSLVVSSFVDFGVFGVLVYPVFIATLIVISAYLFKTLPGGIFRVYGMFYILVAYLIVEQQPVFYMINLRHLPILIVIALIFSGTKAGRMVQHSSS